MDYVRTYIKKYWGIAYRRTLGIALVTMAIILSMGLTFTVLRQSFAVNNYIGYMLFWFLLMLIGIVTFLSNFLHSHISSTKMMTEEEHKLHSKYMAIWMMSIVGGVIAFLIPLFFVGSYVAAPLFLLFTFGGVLLVLYASILAIFRHHYGELVIGAAALWIMFLFGLSQLGSSGLNYAGSANFSIYYTILSFTVVSGFVGIALLINSSRESLDELMRKVAPSARRQRRRRRASG
ncbi:MAG: hypothetical protein KGI06_03440 [Candidatus Micrarchaeota archaeon]|nr:hypothetical protein [Candidatus Micrarchaeota archaeon]